MNKTEKLDQLLKQVLASEVEPDEELNQKIINQFKETNKMNSIHRKRISIGVLVAVLMLIMSVTAYAATQLFSSKQIAEQLGDKVLAEVFESSDSIEVNETIASGDYNFTLHGIVSGAGLTELTNPGQSINPDRTYAVVSIARQDGSLMPKKSDPEYGKDSFFVSPLIKGQKPWQVNIASMNGGYSEIVLEGIMYRLIECDGMEIFADRGIYLAISSGSTFFSNDAFAYNESSGEVSPRTDYKGASLLFDLPLDKAKADPVKAEAYLQELLKEPSTDSSANSDVTDDDAEVEMLDRVEELKGKLPDGKVIPESVKEVTYDDEGRILYEYDGFKTAVSPEMIFEEGQTGGSDSVHFSVEDQTSRALQFSRDENGVITGRVIELN
ncbi:MAG TPA: hypothetical protein IAA29_05460 [Candidatus Paenibacillus intestinavium]|nr:hypothetical protein [Candidatus Paenibacillus intestinavium]